MIFNILSSLRSVIGDTRSFGNYIDVRKTELPVLLFVIDCKDCT